MKKNLFKAVGSVLIVAAAVAAASPVYSRADDNPHKRGARDFAQPKVQVVAVATKADAPACGGCRNEYTTTVTQDSKLKTKMIALQNHLCTSCKTTVATLGPKSAPRDVMTHSCLAAGSGRCCN